MATRGRLIAGLFPVAAALVALAGLRCSGVSCRTIETDLGALCLPETAAPNTGLLVELREQCGGNCSRQPSCTATLVERTIVLDVHQDICNDVSLVNCSSEQCLRRTARCALPAVPEGDYTVHATGLEDQLLRVRAGGTVACTLPPLPPDAGTSSGSDAGTDGGV